MHHFWALLIGASVLLALVIAVGMIQEFCAMDRERQKGMVMSWVLAGALLAACYGVGWVVMKALEYFGRG